MQFIAKTRGGESYDGLRMMTAVGVHDAAERLIRRAYSDKQLKSMTGLDLASGQGALAKRLANLGLSRVDAWELEADQFKPQDIKVKSVDLNGDWPSQRQYDLITACEIIEHLENPYHFMRQIASLLKPGGSLILSTPNVESAASRLEFLWRGQLRWFHEEGYADWGHIMPVTSWMLDKALRQSQLRIADQDYNNQRQLSVIDHKSHLPFALFGLLLYPIMRGNKRADIAVWRITHQSR